MRLVKTSLSISLLILLLGCETVKLTTLEKLGYEKREILTSRIEKAKEAQEEAKEQFQSALQEFQSVVKFDGGNLENIYNQLNDEYELSNKRSEAVSEKIASIEYVADKLFDEWKSEIKQYTSAKLRKQSQAQLVKTQKDYQQLIKTMRNVEKRIKPVLAVFHDQVLYLKHNLNARAIASLKSELSTIKADVNKLISQMNRSINEANQFIENMKN